MFLLEKQYPAFFSNPVPEKNNKLFIGILVFILTVLVLLAFVSVNIHGEMNGAHDRFPLN
jgi:hypothetical protein